MTVGPGTANIVLGPLGLTGQRTSVELMYSSSGTPFERVYMDADLPTRVPTYQADLRIYSPHAKHT